MPFRRRRMNRPRRKQRRIRNRRVGSRRFGLSQSRLSKFVDYRPGDVFPQRFLAKMVCEDNYIFNNPAASKVTTANPTFKLNSVFNVDPLASFKPNWYTELSATYDKCRVYGCKIEVIPQVTIVTATGVPVAQPDPLQIVLLPVTDAGLGSVSFTTIQEAAAMPYAKQLILPTVQYSAKPAKIRHYMSIRKIFGINKIESMGKDYVMETAATDPNLLARWTFIHGTTNGVNLTATNSVIYRVRLTYYTEWFDRLLPVVSN